MQFMKLLKFCLIISICGQLINCKDLHDKKKLKTKLRVCVVEGRGSYKKASKFCPILESNSTLECVIGLDRLDCVRRIHKGSAHFGVFSSEDLVAARWAAVELLITSEMRFDNSPFEYEIVAVIDNESGIHSAQDLRGSKFCHPGHALEHHWTEILANYFESTLVPRQCEAELSLVESRIKATANFFGPTCKAGPWVPDPIQDRILKNRYPSLCQMCYDSYRCDVGDKHWGRRGTLYCLTSGGGDVSWARLDDVRSHFGLSGLQAEANPNQYSFLCPDGHLQPINATHPCVWVAKPWPAVAAKRENAAEIQDLVHGLSHDGDEWKNALLSLMETYHVNINSLDMTIPIDDYLDQAVGFQSAYSFPSCNPPRSIVYCTTSIIQHIKCSWLQEASAVYGVEPNIQCIRSEDLDRCLDDTSHKAADIVMVDQDDRVRAQRDYHLKPLLFEFSKALHERYATVAVVRASSGLHTIKDLRGKKACFPSYEGAAWLSVFETLQNLTSEVHSIHSYFSKSSCLWGPKGIGHCREDFLGDQGALRCLIEGHGDVAFLSSDVYKNFTSGTLNSTWHKGVNPILFKLVCPFPETKKRRYDQYDDICFMHWTPRGHLMINNATSLLRQNEIFNSLRDMDKLFGKSAKSYTMPFTMFGPFDKRNNIMFHDTTDGLRGLSDLKKDRVERLLEPVYYTYLTHKFEIKSEGVVAEVVSRKLTKEASTEKVSKTTKSSTASKKSLSTDTTTEKRKKDEKGSVLRSSVLRRDDLRQPPSSNKVKLANPSSKATAIKVKSETKSTADQIKSTKLKTQTTPRTDVKVKARTASVIIPKVEARSSPRLDPKLKMAVKDKKQPLRAVAIPEVMDQLKKMQNRPLSKVNVMNTVHNVTVSSPPPRRREIEAEDPQSLMPPMKEAERSISPVRDRTRTRTLGPDEVLVLKKSPYLSASEKSKLDQTHAPDRKSLKVKEPVAFEINFPEDLKPKSSKTRSGHEQPTTSEPLKSGSDSASDDYEDDFESYESDFETGSSTHTSNSTEEDAEVHEEEEGTSETSEDSSGSEAEESEETQPPVTVVQRDEERKLDSGNYDLNSKKDRSQSVLDSLDTSVANSGQFDSGISYPSPNSTYETKTQKPQKAKPKMLSKRALELMSKIELDTVAFALFEVPPMKYELYMRMYGALSSAQAGSQTNENRLDTECQTDEIGLRSIWTQHPPRYDLQFMQETQNGVFENSCGETELKRIRSRDKDVLNRSLNKIEKLFKTEKKMDNFADNRIDPEKLNNFLNKALFTLSDVLSKGKSLRKLKGSGLSISNGFYNINTSLFDKTKITKIFSYRQSNFLLLVHENLEYPKNCDFFSLVSLWDVNEPENPLKLLSTWSQICCAEICPNAPSIVVGGLADGTIALWDLQDSFTYQRKLKNGLKIVTPTQIVTPSIGEMDYGIENLGPITHLKSMKPESCLSSFKSYEHIQFASLNESGVLAVWNLVESVPEPSHLLIEDAENMSKMEYHSPWSQVKLTQTAVCDLKSFIHLNTTRIKTKYKMKHSDLESDLFSQSVLKDIETTNETEQGSSNSIVFTSLDTSSDKIYIATNHNFFISCTKVLKTDRFRKVIVDVSSLIFIVTMKVMPNEEFIVLGLSNGTVQAFYVGHSKPSGTTPEETTNSNEAHVGATMDPSLGVGPAKSCAIQNIIESERRAYEDQMNLLATDRRMSTGDENLQMPRNFEPKVADGQMLLDAVVTTKSPKISLQALDLTKDDTKLLALTNGTIRFYDFVLNKEIDGGTSDHIKKIGLAKGKTGHQNLVLLTDDNEVQVHVLK